MRQGENHVLIKDIDGVEHVVTSDSVMQAKQLCTNMGVFPISAFSLTENASNNKMPLNATIDLIDNHAFDFRNFIASATKHNKKSDLIAFASCWLLHTLSGKTAKEISKEIGYTEDYIINAIKLINEISKQNVIASRILKLIAESIRHENMFPQSRLKDVENKKT